MEFRPEMRPKTKAKKKGIGLPRGSAAVVIAIALTIAASATRAQSSASAQTPQAATTLIGNHPDEAADFASGPEISGSKTLRMQISLALHNQDALRNLIAAQQDPSSAQYHQWLTPGEFTARFGPTPADISTVSSWLGSKGFTVESTSAAKRAIVFTGPAATAEKVFKVKIHTDESGTLYANLGDPSLPASIAPIVGSIRGLSNILRAHPNASYVPDATASPGVTINGITHFGPNDLYTFYDQTPPTSSSNDGSGADCIAVIEDSNFDDASVTAFNSQFNLPSMTANHILSSNNGNPGVTSDEVEALLDVEYAHAAAPGVPVYAYIGDDATSTSGSGLIDAGIRAVSDNTCGAIGISFSFCGGSKKFYSQQLNAIAMQAATQGQAVFAATGDFGAAGLVFNKKTKACAAGKNKNVSELAADPHITAVGGTQFTPNYQNGNDVGSVPESVWNDASGAGGGGNSRIFAKPAFQKGIRHIGSRRAIPDISFAASPNTPGFFLGSNGTVGCCIGGTSLGTPYWAGIAQLAAQRESKGRVGNLNTTLYAISKSGGSGIRDVTQGTNGFNRVRGFTAVPGYDRASGLGTPDIELLLSAIAAQ
jgi:subtilase family serine protease